MYRDVPLEQRKGAPKYTPGRGPVITPPERPKPIEPEITPDKPPKPDDGDGGGGPGAFSAGL